MKASAFRIGHVELNVSQLARSVAFYDRLFGHLGCAKRHEFKNGAGWSNGETTFFVFQTEPRHAGRPYHRGGTGLNHVAFRAPSRDAVDRFYEEFLGKACLYGGPKDYSEYRDGYYAVYFEDPDRVKIEYAYIPD